MEEAIVLAEPSESSVDGKLMRAMEFFGIAARRLTVDECLSVVRGGSHSKIRLLCTAEGFLRLLAEVDSRVDGPDFWPHSFHSVFLFAASNFSALEQVAARIATGCSLARRSPAEDWIVTEGKSDFCKSMSGIRVRAVKGDPDSGFYLEKTISDAVSLISDGKHSSFISVQYQTIPFFVSTTPDVVDVRENLTARDFDIRQHFLSAVPLVLYVQWAFPESRWRAPETPACLVIDDPLLKPRYGFLRFQLLLDVMQKHHFSTSIAFIPWNWRRNNSKVVRLFRENPEKLSLSIHGCDHTGGEFGSLHTGRLSWKSKVSLQRMWHHQTRTGLAHDAVMVFPQGVFSARAMEVLKRSQFLGVVNSEVYSTDSKPLPISIGDYWKVGVINYSDFPIFTRRYASAGIENFAFDILVGKPCLMVAHHNDCFDDCRHIVEFTDRLNNLNVQLRWTNLADVIRRSFRQREISPGIVEVEIYGNEVKIDNSFHLPSTFRISKRESEMEHVKAVHADGQPIQWKESADGRCLTFEVRLNPGERRIVTVVYREYIAADGFEGESLQYRIKATVRRYLSEFRDNYVSRKSFST
jgi:hypothetical protein